MKLTGLKPSLRILDDFKYLLAYIQWLLRYWSVPKCWTPHSKCKATHLFRYIMSIRSANAWKYDSACAVINTFFIYHFWYQSGHNKKGNWQMRKGKRALLLFSLIPLLIMYYRQKSTQHRVVHWIISLKTTKRTELKASQSLSRRLCSLFDTFFLLLLCSILSNSTVFSMQSFEVPLMIEKVKC